jgi:hypothetical protein
MKNEWMAPIMTDKFGICDGTDHTDMTIEGCFNIITNLKEIPQVCDEHIIWILQSLEDLTSTKTEESRKIVWSLLKRLAGLDETETKDFHNPDRS